MFAAVKRNQDHFLKCIRIDVAMIRPEGKAKKIAFKILGTPANMQKTSAARKKINKRLLYEDTKRAR